MEYVQEFIRLLCDSPELENFNRIRIYLDEDYTSAEHFTVNKNKIHQKKHEQNKQIIERNAMKNALKETKYL